MREIRRFILPLIVAVLTTTSIVYAYSSIPEDYPLSLVVSFFSFSLLYVGSLTLLAWTQPWGFLQGVSIICFVLFATSVIVGGAVFLAAIIGKA